MRADPYQQKSLALFGAISLTITIVDAIFIIFFPKQLQQFLPINLFFIIFTVFFALSRFSGKTCSHEASPHKKSSPIKWLGAILGIELLAGLFFLNILQTSQLFLNAEILPLHFHIPKASSICHLLLIQWGLFPFGLIALLAAGLAYTHYAKQKSATISNLLPSSRKTYYEVFIKRVVNGSLGAISNFVMIISISLGILTLGKWLLSLFGVHSVLQVRVGSMIFFVVVLVLSITKIIPMLANAFSKFFKNDAYAILSYMIFALIVFVLCYVFAFSITHFVSQYVTLPDFQHLHFHSHMIVRWHLLFWAWWICWSPLIATAIARVSYGYTLRSIILATLCFPAMIAIGFETSVHVPGLASLSHWLFAQYWLAVIGPALLIALLMRVNGGKLMVFGFMPSNKANIVTQTVKPIHFVRSTLRVTIAFMAVFLIRNIYGIQFLTLLAAIPNTVFFIALSILFYTTLARQS